MSNLGLFFLRLGLGGVFLWFGIDKFFNPSIWSRWIPEWFASFLFVEEFTFVYMTGVFEALIGLLLLIGLYTRLTAGIAAAMLMVIAASLGYNDIMIRDLGLAFMSMSIMMLGPGDNSLDRKFRKLQKLKEAAKSYQR